MILDEKKEEILRDAHPFTRLKYNLSCRVTGHSQSLLRTHCISVFHKESIKEKGPCHLVFREKKKLPKGGMWRIKVFGKSWNEGGIRSRQLWLRSYRPLQPYSKLLFNSTARYWQIGSTEIKRDVLSLQTATTQHPVAPKQKPKTGLLPLPHITATNDFRCLDLNHLYPSDCVSSFCLRDKRLFTFLPFVRELHRQ